MASVPLQALPQARLLQMQQATALPQVRPLVQQPALCATTSTSVTDAHNLNRGASARPYPLKDRTAELAGAVFFMRGGVPSGLPKTSQSTGAEKLMSASQQEELHDVR